VLTLDGVVEPFTQLRRLREYVVVAPLVTGTLTYETTV